jgi:signal transduction histidine kinase
MIFRVICLVFSFYFLLPTPYPENDYTLMILSYLAIGTVLFIGLATLFFNKKIILTMLFFDYFLVLIYPYYSPHFIILEFIWIPEILSTLAVFLPSILGILLIFFMGIPGSIFLSYGYYQEIYISIGEKSYPFYRAVIPFYLSITLLSVVLCQFFISSRKREKYTESLETLNEHLNKINHSVSQKIFYLENDSTLEERKRISKEIHDTAGYVFINLIMMLQAASAVFYKDIKKAESLINDARDYAARGINEIRHILRNIREYSPLWLSLQNELYNIGTAFNKATEVKININYGNWPKTFSKNIDSFFISFMQEALTNSLKHGYATEVSITCWETRDFYAMSIIDNGKGAVLPIEKGIGITALEDIVNRYSGNVVIKSDRTGFGIHVFIKKTLLCLKQIPHN